MAESFLTGSAACLGLVRSGLLLRSTLAAGPSRGLLHGIIALKPDFHGWYFSRGLIYLKQKDYALATADFNEALRLRPDRVEARFNRAVARLGKIAAPRRSRILRILFSQGHDDVRTHLLLAAGSRKGGRQGGSRTGTIAGMRCQPSDDVAWVSRAIVRCKNDPVGAVEISIGLPHPMPFVSPRWRAKRTS